MRANSTTGRKVYRDVAYAEVCHGDWSSDAGWIDVKIKAATPELVCTAFNVLRGEHPHVPAEPVEMESFAHEPDADEHCRWSARTQMRADMIFPACMEFDDSLPEGCEWSPFDTIDVQICPVHLAREAHRPTPAYYTGQAA